MVPYNIVSYRTIPYHTILYRTIPYHTIPYHTIPYHTIPYHTIPYHTIPHHTIPHYTLLHYSSFPRQICPLSRINSGEEMADQDVDVALKHYATGLYLSSDEHEGTLSTSLQYNSPSTAWAISAFSGSRGLLVDRTQIHLYADPGEGDGPRRFLSLNEALSYLLCYAILYDTTLYYAILCYTILYCTILYYTILYYTILYYAMLCYTMLYYAILCYTIVIPFQSPRAGFGRHARTCASCALSALD